MEKAILVFQTDFTYKEGAVCAMYGVVKSVDRTLDIIDGTHEIPQYDIWSASYRLYQSMKFWPEGTVFVSVVDPGVGTSRKACVAKTKDGYYVVTPDNGTLTHLKKFVGIEEIREIDENINRLKGKNTEGVSIFHGRDLFGYCAARLASNIITYEQVGPKYDIDKIVSFDILQPKVENKIIKGIFEINDPNFGNLWSNIPTKLFFENGINYGDDLEVIITNENVEVYHKNVRFDKSFGMVNKGVDIIYNNELMKISMAISMGSFIEKYKIGYGDKWKVSFAKI